MSCNNPRPSKADADDVKTTKARTLGVFVFVDKIREIMVARIVTVPKRISMNAINRSVLFCVLKDCSASSKY